MIDFDEAIRAHLDWTEAFRTAIVLGRRVETTDIARDDLCDLGRWLHSEEARRFSGSATYDRLVAAHATFHREAAKVAELINSGRGAEAERRLWVGSSYSRASAAVREALRALGGA